MELGSAWPGAWKQLEAAIKMHAQDERVAAFGTTCGILKGAAKPEDVTSAQVQPLLHANDADVLSDCVADHAQLSPMTTGCKN